MVKSRFVFSFMRVILATWINNDFKKYFIDLLLLFYMAGLESMCSLLHPDKDIAAVRFQDEMEPRHERRKDSKIIRHDCENQSSRHWESISKLPNRIANEENVAYLSFMRKHRSHRFIRNFIEDGAIFLARTSISSPWDWDWTASSKTNWSTLWKQFRINSLVCQLAVARGC